MPGRRLLLQLTWSFAFWILAITSRAQAVTYQDIAPLLEQRCVLCHTGQVAPRGVRLDSYENVIAGGERGPIVANRDVKNSELIRRLRGDSLPRMPMTGPPFLADAEIALFEKWIESGLPEGTPAQVPAGDSQAAGPGTAAVEAPPASVSFGDVAVIFATRCAKCHTGNGIMGAAPEGYRLDSYSAAIDTGDRVRIVPGNPAASELVRRIRGQARPRMPFDGPPYLSATEILLIEEWVAAGARNTAGDPAPLPVGEEIRLEGELTGRWQVDDLPLVVTPKTRIRKNPRIGDTVRIRGSVQSDGSIRVERLRRD